MRGYRNIIEAASIYLNGRSYIGEAATVTLPNVQTRMEDHRPQRLPSDVKRFTGYEPLVVEAVFNVYDPEILKQVGNPDIRAYDYQARWSARSADGSVKYGVAEFSGRGSSAERGAFENGEEPAQTTLTVECISYKETFDGEEIYNMDTELGKWEVGGEDYWAPVLEGL